MTAAWDQAARLGDAADEARHVLWSQFILAAALAGVIRRRIDAAGEESVILSYVDTHAGPGCIPSPAPWLEVMLAARREFAGQVFFDALTPALAGHRHPGSWLLAGRIMRSLARPDDAAEIDVNDLSESVIEQARRNREDGWVRFWSHDWFLFLRSRLGMGSPPSFVFIDPPADDPRGPAYATDAAILLDTLSVPYMVSYPARDPQACIDQIGRTGLELHVAGGEAGVLLGGGAERALLHLIPDLRRLAALLGGELVIRLPSQEDYCI